MTGAASSASDPLRAAFAACRRHFVAAAVFSALLNVLYLAPTLYMLQVYDRVVPTRGALTLLFLTLVLLFALAILSLLDVVRSRLLIRASCRLDRQLAGVILDATLASSAGGRDAVTRQAMREFDTLRQTMTGTGVLALFDAPWTPIYILVCYLLHPLLGLVALVGGAVLVAITWLNERATKGRLQRATDAANLAYISQEQSVTGAEVLRALGMRWAMIRRHLRERETTATLQAEASFAGGGYIAASRFARAALQSLALGVGAWLAINQKISPGAIFAASLLVARALAPIDQVLGAWKSVVQARGAWRTLSDLLGRAAPSIGMTQLPAPSGALEVERLVVMNPARDGVILQGINFGVAAGEIVGVIGPSGAGKTTLMRMIAGAGQADQGAIRLDGAQMHDWEPERLARSIGYMPQGSLLFCGTVKDNISRFRIDLGEDPMRIDEMAVEAARLSGAHDMIVRLPRGYDTPLGWGGTGLSAGQTQRVALARALFGEPSLVILDEPNAHLDMEGEMQLIQTLASLKARGATVLIVAHRTGVLAAVDKLMALRDGRIELFGGRDETIARISAGTARPATGQLTQPLASL
jgi:ATP-binding cassette subfamily C protein